MKMKYVLALMTAYTALQACVLGQVPSLVNYQGRLLEAGVPVNSNVVVAIGIYSSETALVATYLEDVGPVPVVNGLYAFTFGTNELGMVAALASPEAWLEVNLDGVPLSPRQQLLAVPYALSAAGVPSGSITSDDLADGAVSSTKLALGSVSNGNIHANAAIEASKISDGSGSGLDADQLDGVESASFLRSDASDVFNDAGLDMDLRFEGSTEPNLLRLDASTDRIGIGVSSPASKLHIGGGIDGELEVLISNDPMFPGEDSDVSVEFSSDGTPFQIGIDSTDGSFKMTPNSSFSSGVPHLTITDGGNVGIGDDTPDARLDVLQVGSGDAFRVDDTLSDSSPFVIANNGDVGIGNASPDAKLDIVGDALISSDLTVDSSTLFVDASANEVGIGIITPAALLHLEQVTTTDAFRVDDLASDPTPFVITASGDVGVGTSTPSAKVDIIGDVDISSDLSVDSSTLVVDASANEVGIGDAFPDAKLDVLQTGAGDAFRVDDQNGDTTPFLIANDGDVGIGDPTPDAKLDVVGDVIISSDLTVGTSTLFVDASANEVGIGIINPTETLDVGGSVQVSGEYTYDAAKQYHHFISAGEFDPVEPNVTAFRTTVDGNRSFADAASGTITAYAGINLPEGAVVTRLRGYFADRSTAAKVDLFRIDMYRGFYTSVGTPTTMATLSGSSFQTEVHTSYDMEEDSTINNATVNNASYFYVLRLTWEVTGPNTSDLLFRGVRVTYELSEVSSQ